ncbi:MAG: 2-aminoethylphosphonate--pyruvate transaminase [Candidatus Omnitrophica bacterium]|nr:2-aminoethylphosphonate--pyruvate transaminase [Candidatus Omnitrophota bacterium]
MHPPIAASNDKPLFTPGPLTTSRTVKQAMLRDLGSRDFEFVGLVRDIRDRLLALGGVDSETYAAIPMQGSGTFAIEAVLSSAIPPEGKLLVIVNGAYGKRMVQMARIHKIDTLALEFPEDQRPSLDEADRMLASHPGVTHVAVVHCETTTGILNPIEELGRMVRARALRFVVDAMSSFGAIPTDLARCEIDFLVSSANKCIEGVPGFAFVLARKEALLETEGWARTLSLDILAQWRGLESNGQFRFTPPTHALLAFHQALLELEQEGGVEGRHARYSHNHEVLIRGMREIGFEEYLAPELQGPIITSFRYPEHPNFSFEEFYRRLNERNYVIYPGKVSNADCFRIGTIGRIFESDILALLAAVREVVLEMGVELAPIETRG